MWFVCAHVYVVPSSKCIYILLCQKKYKLRGSAWFCHFTFFLFAVWGTLCCDLICGERLMKRRNLQQERNGASYPFDIPDRIHLLSVWSRRCNHRKWIIFDSVWRSRVFLFHKSSSRHPTSTAPFPNCWRQPTFLVRFWPCCFLVLARKFWKPLA